MPQKIFLDNNTKICKGNFKILRNSFQFGVIYSGFEMELSLFNKLKFSLQPNGVNFSFLI